MRTEFFIDEAAALLGVSDDTIRRWADVGRLTIGKNASGRQVVAGTELVPLLTEHGSASQLAASFPGSRTSARNRFIGIVTAVTVDGVMAQVDLQAGPFRVVSLMTRESAEELELTPGMLAVASTKATNITIDVLEGPQ
jgi:molybdopterin-binding protein